MNALATNANLHHRQCAPSPICKICDREEESLAHCLFGCSNAASVWVKCLPQIKIPLPHIPFREWIAGIENTLNDPSLKIKVAAVCWNVWKARNEKCFRGVYPTKEHIFSLFTTDLNDWTTLIDTTHPAIPSPHPPSITIPPPNYQSLTIHCDGSFLHDSQKAAYGVVLSNSAGRIINGIAGTFYCNTPIVSEARAILEATKLASNIVNMQDIVIYSDCQELIFAINGPKHRWPWECLGYIGRILDISASLNTVSFRFTSRKMNAKADWVARNARLGLLNGDWVSSL